jgi:ABC-type bacteriocin/lantibiotic exporter with double-glycine peptidase domain
METSVSPVARVWSLVREERADITAIYFFSILSGLIQLSIPIGIQSIIGFVVGGTLSASLAVLITMLVAAVLLAGILQINQMKIVEKIQQRIFVKIAHAFADRIPMLDLKKVDGFYLPELVNRFFDTVSLQKSISKLLLDLPIAMMQVLFGLILLCFYHPFFILFGVLLLLLLWLILYTTGNKGFESSLAESGFKYAVAGWLEEMARLVHSFKFSPVSNLHLQKADQRTVKYIRARTEHFSVLLLQFKTLVGFKVAITAAMLIAGVVLLLNQQINIGQFVATEIIILTVINSVEKIIINLDSVYDVLTSVTKIGKLTDKPIETSGSYKINDELPVMVEAQELQFGYQIEKPVIKNASFKINAGEKVCIKGNDGSGKSTLLKLLSGVYKDFSGSILFNEIPIGNYDLTSLREKTGILLRSETIFHGTLWENLTMGKASADRNYITFLCNQTGLNSFVSTLPPGFDAELDPTGKRLPGNVIQKILLVRALAHKPLLLLMEEPWLGIEEQYRNRIQDLLLNINHATLIVTTNDEAFSKRCDQIIQLKF